MNSKKEPLAERIQLVELGCCAHAEYIEAIIRQFAQQNIVEYMQQYEQELHSIQSLLGISCDGLKNMTYQQLCKAIDDMLFETPSCGDGYLYGIIDQLMQPLLREEQVENAVITSLEQQKTLEQRLKPTIPPKEQLMCGMNVEGVLCNMDFLVGGETFTRTFMQYFEPYGAETICELIKRSEQMPHEERDRIRYRLMIEPFAALEACETANR